MRLQRSIREDVFYGHAALGQMLADQNRAMAPAALAPRTSERCSTPSPLEALARCPCQRVSSVPSGRTRHGHPHSRNGLPNAHRARAQETRTVCRAQSDQPPATCGGTEGGAGYRGQTARRPPPWLRVSAGARRTRPADDRSVQWSGRSVAPRSCFVGFSGPDDGSNQLIAICITVRPSETDGQEGFAGFIFAVWLAEILFLANRIGDA